MKNRYINTKFWSDTWVVELDPLEKYLFLYLLTNERTNICGVYELPLRFMALETGLDAEMLKKIFSRFERDQKAYYIHGWVYVVNFAKHQKTDSPTVQEGIKMALARVPKEIMAAVSQKGIGYVYPMDKVGIKPEQLELESELELELKPKPDTPTGAPPQLLTDTTESKTPDEVEKLYGLWNKLSDIQKSQGIPTGKSLPHHTRLTPDMRRRTERALKELKSEELEICMKLYATVIQDDACYWKHRYTFEIFMQRGYKNFYLQEKSNFIKYQTKATV